MTNGLQVAETILEQFGGAGRLSVMAGCKDFLGDSNSVQFKIGANGCKATACRVELDASDTYTVTFYCGRGVRMREVASHSFVYGSSLRALFESATGLRLTL